MDRHFITSPFNDNAINWEQLIRKKAKLYLNMNCHGCQDNQMFQGHWDQDSLKLYRMVVVETETDKTC